MFVLRMLLLLGLYALGLNALEITVCDCEQASQKGILQFSDEDCQPEKNENRTNAVNYSVYTEKREELKFPGYICARWKQIKHITTSFFGQKVVVPDKIALETSPLECLTMYESRRCNEQPMTINDKKIFYDQEPVEDGWWLETVTVETINCAVEKIQLYQETEGESFSTPLGIAPATAGSISHNHLTLIWDKTFTVKSEPKARLFLDNENDLTREIENLQCEKRKATHERVVSTAQFNGWLAASMVNLPKCTKLSAFGKTVLAITCKVRNVSFAAEVTNCGPQPKFEKYTINRDGWELVPFSPCYWSVGFINFNDKPYAYSNGTWRPIVAQIVVPTQTLAHSFRYNEVKYFDYVHQSNPAYNDALLDSMNVLADIVSTINDHSAGNFTPSHVPRTTNILVNAEELSVYPDWIVKIKKYFLLAVVIIIAIILIRIFIACGCCNLLKSFCCFLCKPKATTAVNPRARRPLN
ncbi:hypothetical protein DAPPUDRAFT_119105 [Daphnia pulex]|uniref:Uncharacterized protein n=1 Tax=Daphnia pulex TaxID=6669 RepID=E9HXF9_DAPPU|nr:hypothetical protein DAPPUDRAFT_119105 [Daphnia pulex]|eukprot:EFX63573.1 hypothetical protein DAPPUDRAFT_119105 [Daphnia pulex]